MIQNILREAYCGNFSFLILAVNIAQLIIACIMLKRRKKND